MARKKKEFDYEKEKAEIEQEIKDKNLTEDDAINAMMEEFKRMKELADRLYAELKGTPMSYIETGSKGQDVLKTNPFIKDYVNVSSKLVYIASAIKETLARLSMTDEDDFLS